MNTPTQVKIFTFLSEVSNRLLGMRPFDSQMLAGLPLHDKSPYPKSSAIMKMILGLFTGLIGLVADEGSVNDNRPKPDAAKKLRRVCCMITVSPTSNASITGGVHGALDVSC